MRRRRVQVSASVSEEDSKALQELSEISGISQSSLVRMAVKEFLKGGELLKGIPQKA